MTKSYIDTIYNTSRRPFTSYPSKLAKEISPLRTFHRNVFSRFVAVVENLVPLLTRLV